MNKWLIGGLILAAAIILYLALGLVIIPILGVILIVVGIVTYRHKSDQNLRLFGKIGIATGSVLVVASILFMSFLWGVHTETTTTVRSVDQTPLLESNH